MEFVNFINAFKKEFDITGEIDIKPETDIDSVVDWNSMAIVNFLVFLDDTFNVDVDAQKIKMCKTFDDLYALTM